LEVTTAVALLAVVGLPLVDDLESDPRDQTISLPQTMISVMM